MRRPRPHRLTGSVRRFVAAGALALLATAAAAATTLSVSGGLTPLAGISFGHAPYLWPLFLILDLIAAAAVVPDVRRTMSATPGAD